MPVSGRSDEHAARAEQFEREADRLWSEYKYATQQAQEARWRESQAKAHERRVAAVDEALRRVP